jgi:hypothetical protein
LNAVDLSHAATALLQRPVTTGGRCGSTYIQ